VGSQTGAAIGDHRCMETEDQAVAAGHSVDPGRLDDDFAGLLRRTGGRFARAEPRRRMGKFVRGLPGDLPRKNCWTIAEWAGEATPDGMQHLLERAKWDANAVRDNLRRSGPWSVGPMDGVVVGPTTIISAPPGRCRPRGR
jgi:hypothetical protein